MNTNIEINDSINNILIFLKEKLAQLIEFNSISQDDIKKICTIAYGLKENYNFYIDNYLINIFGQINYDTKIYTNDLIIDKNLANIYIIV